MSYRVVFITRIELKHITSPIIIKKKWRYPSKQTTSSITFAAKETRLQAALLKCFGHTAHAHRNKELETYKYSALFHPQHLGTPSPFSRNWKLFYFPLHSSKTWLHCKDIIPLWIARSTATDSVEVAVNGIMSKERWGWAFCLSENPSIWEKT